MGHYFLDNPCNSVHKMHKVNVSCKVFVSAKLWNGFLLEFVLEGQHQKLLNKLSLLSDI